MIPGLGQRIAQARQAVGLGRVACAAQIGLSRHQLRFIESGTSRNPGASVIYHVARVCGVTSDWLLGLSQAGGPGGREHGGV